MINHQKGNEKAKEKASSAVEGSAEEMWFADSVTSGT